MQKTAAPALAPNLSLTLDAVRLFAALAVLLCHFSARRMSGGLLWELNPYGAQAVDVFFVLSGYLITVAARHESSGRAFAAGRLARIYSVAAPAALVTFVADSIGRPLAPFLYADMPAFAPLHPPALLQATGGLLFFNEAWGLHVPVGSNVPWWSLGYEVAYYAAFAFGAYGTGRWRLLLPAALALAAGPAICALSPLWLAGALVGRAHLNGVQPRAARLLPWAALLAWIGYEIAVHRWGRPFGVFRDARPEIVQDWVIGALFAAALFGLPHAVPRRPAPAWLAGAIRFGAGRSFALYLLHYPVMLCLHAVMLRLAPGLSPYWLLPGTLGAVLLLAEVTERRRPAWRAAFTALLRPLPAPAPALPT